MTNKRFLLVATVSTDKLEAIRPTLEKLIGRHGSMRKVNAEVYQMSKGEFLIEAEI